MEIGHDGCNLPKILKGNVMKRQKTNRQLLWEEATGHCVYCGHPVTAEGMEVDHITPLSLGGGNGMENKVCSCPRCNATKAGRSLEEFLDSMSAKERRRYSNRVNTLAEQGKMDWEKAELLDPYTKENWDTDWDDEEDTDSLAEENGLASILINLSAEIHIHYGREKEERYNRRS